MPRLLPLFCLWVVLRLPAAVQAQVQAQFGDVCLALNTETSSLVADPVRDRIYAILLREEAVAVIDTTTFNITAKIPYTGVANELAISPDGNTLYVAEGFPHPYNPSASERLVKRYPATPNNFAFYNAVESIDLNTLQLTGSTPLPDPAFSVAAGLSGRLYVSTETADYSYNVLQVDAATGAVQATLERYISYPLLRLTPDHRTLLVAERNSEPSRLLKYDVSTLTPRLLQSVTAGNNAKSLSISHNGQFACVPCYDGNDPKPSTALLSVADLGLIYGKFSTGYAPGAVAFSPDDSLAYQTYDGQNQGIVASSTNTFAKAKTAGIPNLLGDDSYPYFRELIADRTGSYLFVTQSVAALGYGQVLAAVATGTGPLQPAALLPSISAPDSPPTAAGAAFSYQINATHQPTGYGAKFLPQGLTINAQTGLISGVIGSTEHGIYEVQLSASNAAGTAYKTLYLDVRGADDYPPVVTSAGTATASLNTPFNYQITGTHRPSTYTASGLPGGLALNASTGLISGKPVAVGTYIATVGVQNYYGSNAATLTITVTGSTPVITSALEVTAYLEDEDFDFQIVATNRPTSYAASGLPSGISISPTSGYIAGYLSKTGVFPVTISVTNGAGTTTVTLTLTILSRKPVLTNPGTLSARVGTPFTYQVTATNQPDDYFIYHLPSGLTYNFNTGLIFGTPLTAGTFTIEVNVGNSSGSTDGTFTLIISAATAPPPIPPKVYIMATKITLVRGTDTTGVFLLSRDGDNSEGLTVHYTLKGSAKNGKDYIFLRGSKKFKPGKSTTKIKVVLLGAESGFSPKTVKINLTSDSAYQTGGTGMAKLKISPRPE